MSRLCLVLILLLPGMTTDAAEPAQDPSPAAVSAEAEADKPAASEEAPPPPKELGKEEQAKQALQKQLSDLLARIENQVADMAKLEERLAEAQGDEIPVVEEAAWSRFHEHFATLISLTDNLLQQESLQVDVSEHREKLTAALEEHTARLLKQLSGIKRKIRKLDATREQQTPEDMLKVERAISAQEVKGLRVYRSWIDLILAEQRLGGDVFFDIAEAKEKVTDYADKVSARLAATKQKRGENKEALQRQPEDPELLAWQAIYEERFKRACHNLSECIAMLTVLGQDATVYQQQLVSATGEISQHLFSWKVLKGLVADWWNRFVKTLKTDGPSWLAKAIVFLLILLGFKIISWVVRLVAGRAIRSPKFGFSQLLQQVVLSIIGRCIMIIGIFVGLAQIGVPIGHLLAGLGIAGFIVGFALQDVLANFAAGAMILFTRPYDVGDVIEVAGIRGRVAKMNVVSTTILTGDNQTFIVPNAKIWGGVIRNITAQDTRRVDLIFNIAFDSDFERVEELCRQVVDEFDHILPEPAPVIRVQQITDHSVQVVVRPWVKAADYWDTKSKLTKAVTTRLEQNDIEIPRHVLHLPAAKPA